MRNKSEALKDLVCRICSADKRCMCITDPCSLTCPHSISGVALYWTVILGESAWRNFNASLKYFPLFPWGARSGKNTDKVIKSLKQDLEQGKTVLNIFMKVRRDSTKVIEYKHASVIVCYINDPSYEIGRKIGWNSGSPRYDHVWVSWILEHSRQGQGQGCGLLEYLESYMQEATNSVGAMGYAIKKDDINTTKLNSDSNFLQKLADCLKSCGRVSSSLLRKPTSWEEICEKLLGEMQWTENNQRVR